MEKFLTAYIERMRPDLSEIPPSVAHDLASAFLAFRYGIYSNAIRECVQAASHIPDGGSISVVLKKAVVILQSHAESLMDSQVSGAKGNFFSEDEKGFVALNIPADRIEDPETLDLDNALLLVYTVALLRSPDDDEALDEHRKFIIRMLSGYKKLLEP